MTAQWKVEPWLPCSKTSAASTDDFIVCFLVVLSLDSSSRDEWSISSCAALLYDKKRAGTSDDDLK